MTARFFSVPRRKPGMVDLITPIRSGVDGYRIKSATNFDQAFTTVVTAPVHGYVDPEVAGNQHTSYGGDNVRIIFKPSKYSLTDTGALWLQVAFVIGGVEASAGPNAPSAPTLLSPLAGLPTAMQVIAGVAPVAGSIATSQQVDFPRLVENLHIRNNGGGELFVAFDAEGPEFHIPAGVSSSEMVGWSGTVSSMWVRATGSTAALSASFTFANPR